MLAQYPQTPRKPVSPSGQKQSFSKLSSAVPFVAAPTTTADSSIPMSSPTRERKRDFYCSQSAVSNDDDEPVVRKRTRRRESYFFNGNQSKTEARKRPPENPKEVQELRELDLKVFKEIIDSLESLKKKDGTLVYDWFEGAMMARCEFWKRFC